MNDLAEMGCAFKSEWCLLFWPCLVAVAGLILWLAMRGKDDT